jgi:putative ABC transport system ATP-binding protein
VARAIAGSPSVLLADEPTGALDTRTGEEVMALFSKLNAEGTTVVLITHAPEVAAKARRIVSIRDGKILSDVKNSVSPTRAA